MANHKILIITYIASTPEKLWNALTDPNITQEYWGNTRIESDWKVGSKIIYHRNGEITDEHILLKYEPFQILSHTFHPVFGEYQYEKASRVTFELDAGGEITRLTMTHDEFPENSVVYPACSEGWPMILSGLKTLLETGKPLPEFKPS